MRTTSRPMHWLFFILIFATMALAITGIALLIQSLSEHQIKYNYFYEALDELPETKAVIRWKNTQPQGRVLEDNNLNDFGEKLTEAWKAYAMAMHTGNKNLLKDYFASTALERTQHVLVSDPDRKTNMVMMGMTVEPQLFHFDGSFFQFRSDDAIFSRYLIEGKRLIAFTLTKDCVLTNLVVRQSGWKIANHERDCSNKLSRESEAPPWDLPPLKGVNYYPAHSPWNAFWRDYDANQTYVDLQIIKELKVNSVRIFLPRNIFIDSQTFHNALENLEDFIKQSADHDIYVIPTLFDFRGELTPQSWIEDRYYLDQVLPLLARYSNIAYVDLKNEFDLDGDYQNPAIMEAWLRTIVGVSRDIAPELRYSVGWSNAQNALKFAELFDVISYHDYAAIKDSESNLHAIQNEAGGKPVIISEIGKSSYEIFFGLPSSPNKQAQKLIQRLEAFKNSDGVLVWSLYDFPTLDPEAVSGSFFNKGQQRNFGLFNANQKPKPSANVYKEWSFGNG